MQGDLARRNQTVLGLQVGLQGRASRSVGAQGLMACT